MGTQALDPLATALADDAGLGQRLCWLLSRAAHAYMTDVSAALEELEISPRAHQVRPRPAGRARRGVRGAPERAGTARARAARGAGPDGAAGAATTRLRHSSACAEEAA